MGDFFYLRVTMTEKILILDFGSQYTQLIARAVREANVYCEIVPYHKPVVFEPSLKGIILSGSPFSVNDANAPLVDIAALHKQLPVLGVCYGAQLTAKQFGGRVANSSKREYGRALLHKQKDDLLLKDVIELSQVWMSHADTILDLPKGFEVLANTENIPFAAFRKGSNGHTAAGGEQALYCLQFHPEVYHSIEGKKMLKNFLVEICGCKQDWTPAHFASDTIDQLKKQIGSRKVIMALSGGVDSTVAATLIHKAIGDRLYGIFVDNGVLRKNEFEKVQQNLHDNLGLHLVAVDATERFMKKLAGVTDPETKRKIIGNEFIAVFDEEAHRIEMTEGKVEWLVQGTLYPDVIESRSVRGPSQVIKTHHNVGGLPDKMKLKLIEPLKDLFKDEVRRIGRDLEMPEDILHRQPFPGPGLAVRILGEVTKERADMLRECDEIVVGEIKKAGLYQKIWQSFAVLLPVMSVGVMGDQRTYAYTCAVRAVHSEDGMTADWVPLPYEVLKTISNRIVNEVRGVNRVVYDITSKPPGTIEWE